MQEGGSWFQANAGGNLITIIIRLRDESRGLSVFFFCFFFFPTPMARNWLHRKITGLFTDSRCGIIFSYSRIETIHGLIVPSPGSFR